MEDFWGLKGVILLLSEGYERFVEVVFFILLLDFIFFLLWIVKFLGNFCKRVFVFVVFRLDLEILVLIFGIVI